MFSVIERRSQRWIVLTLAVGQAVSTALVFSSDSHNLGSSSADATITPAGYAFAIWLIPILGCLAYAIQNLPEHRASQQPYRSVGRPLGAAMAGFSIWLWLAERNWVWATVVVFAIMLAFLFRAVSPLRSLPTTLSDWIPYITVGVYAGWSTVAVWANLAAAIRQSGDVANTTGWQLAVLLGATGSACLGILATRAQWAYAAAILWAFAAVLVSTVERGAPVLTTTAAAGLLLCLATTAAVQRSRRASAEHRHGGGVL